MKILDSQPLTNRFLAAYASGGESEPEEMQHLIERLITGIIIIENPSPNKVHAELVQGESQTTFYREIHRLAGRMPEYFNSFIRNIQTDPHLRMKKTGVISIDEHIIPHSSPEMEGVAPFYSTTKRSIENGLSMIMAHYYTKGLEYPVSFEGYRREDELEKWGKSDQFREKNEIVRGMIEKLTALENAPDLCLIDSFFMTKENSATLQSCGKSYISRPKRSWKGSIGRRPRMDLGEWYESIPREEFVETNVKNPKMGTTKIYKTAVRDIYFSGIGTHRVVFINCDKETPAPEVIEHHAEVTTTPSLRKFRVFITNELTWSAAEILSLYALRWTIETCFRDMNQHLGLQGCKWRQLQGQYCFIALTLLSYLFLQWAKKNGAFSRYGVKTRTLGQLKTTFSHYCEEQFSLWLGNLCKRCETCPVSNWIFAHLYGGGTGE